MTCNKSFTRCNSHQMAIENPDTPRNECTRLARPAPSAHTHTVQSFAEKTHSMRPVWYSSHCAASQGIMMASVPMTTRGPEPSASVPAICAVIRCTDSASQPAPSAFKHDHCSRIMNPGSLCTAASTLVARLPLAAERPVRALSAAAQNLAAGVAGAWAQHMHRSCAAPWSNSWPRGEELLVRRACLPSRQSRCRYISTAKPLRKYTHEGATPASSGAGVATACSQPAEQRIQHQAS